MYYEINEEMARRAKEAYSMSDYKAGSATADYRQQVDEAAALVEKQKKTVSPFYHEKLDALLDRYAKRLAQWYNDYNRNTASCPSSFITGGSNYNKVFGRKHAKQLSREDTLWKEYNEVKDILSKIKGVGTGPVDLSDPHAREILTGQLTTEKNKLELGKALNKHFRKYGTYKGFPHISDERAEKLDAAFEELHKRAPSHDCPCPSYKLSGIRDRIKRLEKRMAELDKLEAARQASTEDSSTKFPGGEIVRNAELNRLQILFDEIPAAEVRDALKGEGFRWSPKNCAWQRQLTDNAERAARRALHLD